MNTQEFHELTHLVIDPPIGAPALLFAGGFDDWHARARLAHFLLLPQLEKKLQALELFHSIVDIEPNLESAEDIEEKIYALQHLSLALRDDKDFKNALDYINLAIKLAEENDYLYKYILRGELWADRWNILARSFRTDLAADEVQAKIDAYGNLPIKHISYLYFGYRFLAQREGATFHAEAALAYMKKAFSYMDLPEASQQQLAPLLAAPQEDIVKQLQEIDKNTPSPASLHWDI